MGETKEKIDAQSGLAPAADERLAYRGVFQRILTRPEIGAALGALAIWVFFWAVSVPFGRASGASSILDVAASPLGIMAVAVAMLMIGGEFDLSSGAATGALAIVTVLLVRDVTGMMPGGGLSLFLALPISLAAALGLGWFNGTVVNRTGLPSFIVTLGAFFVLRGGKLGFSKLIVGQQEVGKLDDLQAQAVSLSASGELTVFEPENTVEVSVAGVDLVNVTPEVREQIQFNVDNRLDPFEDLSQQVLTQIVRPEGLEVFTVPPPTVDLIQTNIADGLEPLAGVDENLIGVGDRGYGLMADIFSAEWLRNENVWNGRDWFYTIGIVGGLALCALAVYEMNFRRRAGNNNRATFAVLSGIIAMLVGWALLRDVSRVNDIVDAIALQGADIDGPNGLRAILGWLGLALGAAAVLAGIGLEFGRGASPNESSGTGLIVFLAGVAAALVGIWRLHATDSAGANTLAAVIIATGMAVALIGWGMWRYRSRGGVDDALGAMAESAAGLAESGLTRVIKPFVVGIGALALSVGIALWLNPDNDFDLWPTTTDKIDSIAQAKIDAFAAEELESAIEPRVAATVEAELTAILTKIPRDEGPSPLEELVATEVTSLNPVERAHLSSRQLEALTERAFSELNDGELETITETVLGDALAAVSEHERESVTAAARRALFTAELNSLTDDDRQALFDRARTRAESEDPLDIVTVSGRTVALLAVAVGVLVALASQARNLRRESIASVLQSHGLAAIAAGVVGFLSTYIFLFLATEQGGRAIGFVFFAGVGMGGLLTAVNRGRKHSRALGSALLMLTAVAVVALAFFVRSESQTPKFRTQAFTVLLLLGAVMAIWAIATLLFEERSSFDVSADKVGTRILLTGGFAVLIGLTARLMWVTDTELLADISPVKFSVRILWFLAFTALCSWVLARTKFGSWTFAVGGNAQAARQVGVPAARTKTQLFMLVSFAAWLVGLLLAFRLNSIQASTGDGEEFEYIIAAVVGGTMLTGGYGSTIGAAIGAFIMAMSVQGIPSSRWNSDWRFVFLGVILLTAVIANNSIKARAEAAR